MIIHVVQPGETIGSIADRYGVSAARLIQDNGIVTPDNLVLGQAIVIVYPEQTYTVQEGDSLGDIAKAYGVTLMQLLRNNPFLSEREFIYPGETIVISYNNNKGRISTNGYANPYMNREVLRKTLPFLTYLSVFGYRTTEEAEIIDIDDAEIIQMAKEYGVAPIMLLSTLTGEGEGSIEVAYSILYNQELAERHIENILNILNAKGYYGLNITLQYINTENQQIYTNYITQLTNRLNQEGYLVLITLTPNIVYQVNEITFERVDYSGIGRVANGVTLMTYNWGYTFGPPAPVTSVFIMSEFLDYAVTQISPEKIDIGLPVISYDWQLPYIIGVSRANSLSAESAIALASEVGATIQFDETSQTPFFQYTDYSSGIPQQHIVWFVDARSVDAIVNLIPQYGFKGIGIWNIMNFFSQLWLVINTQYEIDTVLT
jgi:spore germination protein